MHDRFAIFLLAFSILTLLLLPVTALLPTADDAAVYDAVIRLHVPANSDSAADQAEKLRICDFATLLFTDESAEQARSILRQYRGAESTQRPQKFTRGLYQRGLQGR